MELAECSIDNNSSFSSVNSNFPFIEMLLSKYHHPNLETKSTLSFYNSAIYGNKKVFAPRWSIENCITDPQYFTSNKWTYLYDHSPLIRTLEKYIDYNKLQPNGKPNTRLIITAGNVLTANH